MNLAVLEPYFFCCGIATHFEPRKLIFEWIVEIHIQHFLDKKSFVFESSVTMLTIPQLRLIFRYSSSIIFWISLIPSQSNQSSCLKILLTATCFNLMVVLEETSPNEDLCITKTNEILIQRQFCNMITRQHVHITLHL